jgi:hypothetical protein
MRIGDEHSFVEFEFTEMLPRHLPSGADVACGVEVSCDGFRGKIKSVWFSREDISRFLSQLQNLEEKRKGSASLTNLSSQSEYSPLRFEVFSVDELGHLAVSANLLRDNHMGDTLRPLEVSVSFPIDAGSLASMLIGFRKLFDESRA